MAENQTAAMKRLLKKLSALRKTLRKDERELLDHLIVRESEVQGHMAFQADLNADQSADQGADSGADVDADLNANFNINLQNENYNL